MTASIATTPARPSVSDLVETYADRIVAGLEHYAGHELDVIVCGNSCDAPLPLRTDDEIHAAQGTLLMLVWDAQNGSNPLRLTRAQCDALMHLNDQLAEHRARVSRMGLSIAPHATGR